MQTLACARNAALSFGVGRLRISLIARRVVVALLAFAIVEYGVVAAMPAHVDAAGTSHAAQAVTATHQHSGASHHHSRGAHEHSSVSHVHALSPFVTADGVPAPLPSGISTLVRLARNDAALDRATAPPLRPPRTQLQA